MIDNMDSSGIPLPWFRPHPSTIDVCSLSFFDLAETGGAVGRSSSAPHDSSSPRHRTTLRLPTLHDLTPLINNQGSKIPDTATEVNLSRRGKIRSFRALAVRFVLDLQCESSWVGGQIVVHAYAPLRPSCARWPSASGRSTTDNT